MGLISKFLDYDMVGLYCDLSRVNYEVNEKSPVMVK
jgi:hypothetical protein